MMVPSIISARTARMLPRSMSPVPSSSWARAKLLIPGDEVLLVGSGYLMGDALTAAEELRAQGISVEVVDPVTIKPFDEELILNETKGKKLVVTYEYHGTVNGIGSAVADVLAKNGAGCRC